MMVIRSVIMKVTMMLKDNNNKPIDDLKCKYCNKEFKKEVLYKRHVDTICKKKK